MIESNLCFISVEQSSALILCVLVILATIFLDYEDRY